MLQELASIKSKLEIDDATTLTVLSALLEKISEHYPAGAVHSFDNAKAGTMAMLPMAGGNPIRLTQVYRQSDHHCYVTFFLGPRLGYELVYRVANPGTDVDATLVNLFVNVVNDVLMGEAQYSPNTYAIKDMADWFGSNLRAVLIGPDPVFQSIQTPVGSVPYLCLLGITESEYTRLTSGKGDGGLDQELAASYVRNIASSNPLLLTFEEKVS